MMWMPVDMMPERSALCRRGEVTRQSRPSVIFLRAGALQVRADGLAEIVGEAVVEIAVGVATDVVLTKNAGVH